MELACGFLVATCGVALVCPNRPFYRMCYTSAPSITHLTVGWSFCEATSKISGFPLVSLGFPLVFLWFLLVSLCHCGFPVKQQSTTTTFRLNEGHQQLQKGSLFDGQGRWSGLVLFVGLDFSNGLGADS